MIGEICNLREFTLADVPLKNKWNNDPKVCKYIGLRPPIYLKSTRKWFYRHGKNPDHYLFIIETKQKKPVGYLRIDKSYEFTGGLAEIHIMLGEKEYWGRGIGQDAVTTASRWCFDFLRVNKVLAHVHIDNAASHRLFEKCGFVKRQVLYELTLRRRK